MKADLIVVNKYLLLQTETDSKPKKSHKSTKINTYILIFVSTMQIRKETAARKLNMKAQLEFTSRDLYNNTKGMFTKFHERACRAYKYLKLLIFIAILKRLRA